LLQIILEYSICLFNKNTYQQQFGTTMGTKPAPPYANIFMARNIDERLWKIAEKYIVNGEIPMKHMKRFLDDIFFVFLGSIEKLHLFLDEINTIHPTIKFTMSHTTPNDQELAPNCSCQKVNSIPYLDTSCEIKAGKIVTDLCFSRVNRKVTLILR
jgi:hypothetical protein